jgi:chromosome segregation ATPase
MSNEDAARAPIIQALERAAELLVVYQMDLLSQIEAQLRGVHHSMRRIERLRAARLRMGPELSNHQWQTTLTGLSAELSELDQQLAEEHTCCGFMQETIKQMQARVVDLRRVAARFHDAESEPSDKGGSVSA